MSGHKIAINRAPVLTLWAAVVAERLGHDWQAALTLGKALAGLNAQSKGQRLGIYEKKTDKSGGTEARPKPGPRPESVRLLGREVPAVHTPGGVRATAAGEPVDPASVEKYLQQKFGEDLEAARTAMEGLAKAYPPGELEEIGFSLYEKFRPTIPEGKKGWGAKGELHLDRIASLSK